MILGNYPKTINNGFTPERSNHFSLKDEVRQEENAFSSCLFYESCIFFVLGNDMSLKINIFVSEI